MNPYLIAYDFIWEMVDNFAPFADEFKAGNIINLADENRRDPMKDNILTADLPEIILIMAGGDGNLHRSSSSSNIIQQFQFLISTGERRLTLISDLKWYAYQALWAWQKQGFGAALYANETFITRLDWVNVVEGESDPALNRGIMGWSTIISFEAEFEFSQTQLEYTDG